MKIYDTRLFIFLTGIGGFYIGIMKLILGFTSPFLVGFFEVPVPVVFGLIAFVLLARAYQIQDMRIINGEISL